MYYFSRQSGFIFRLTYLLLTLFFHAAIFLVAMLGLAHYWLPMVDDYKPVLERELSDFVGNQVSIGSIRVDRDSGEPRWIMENLQLTEPSGASPIFIQQLALRLDWRETLRTLRLQPAEVRLEGVEFTLRQDKGELPEVAGLTFPLPGQKNTALNIERQSPIYVSINGGHVHWQDPANRYTLSLDDLQLEGEFLPDEITIQADALFPPNIGESLMLGATLEQVELPDGMKTWDARLHTRTRIFNLAALPSPWLRQVGVDAGDLMLDVVVQAKAGRPLQFAGEGEIRHLGLQGTERIPALQGIDAVFNASNKGGKVALQIRDSAVHYPAWYEKSLPVDKLSADLSWIVEERGWNWQLSNLALLNADVEANGSGNLFMPVDDDAVLALDVDFRTRHKVSNVADYIPAVVADGTERWLKRAIVAGNVPGGNMQVRGKLADFPFKRNQGGYYDVRFDVEKGVLDYLPDWPVAHDVRGELHFRNEGMTARIDSARIMDLQVRSGEVRIPTMLKNARLQLELDTDGDLQAHMNFLRDAPIGRKLRDAMQSMAFSGDSSLNLQLETSLKKEILQREGVELLGRLALDNCRFEMPGVAQKFTQINGNVSFDRFGVTAKAVRAAYRGEPVRLQAATDKKRQQIIVGLEQNNQPAALLPAVFQPLLPHLEGSADIHTQLTLPAFNFEPPAGTTAALQIQVNSNLQGVGVGLPAPLGKAPAEQRDLQVNLAIPLGSSESWLVDVALGRQFQALAKLPYGTDKPGIVGIGLGGRQARLPDTGIAIRGQLGTVDVLQLAAMSGVSGNGDGVVLRNLSAELDIAELRLGKQSLGKAGFTASMPKAGTIQAHVRADKGQANLFLPLDHPAKGQVNVTLNSVDLGLLEQAQVLPVKRQGSSPHGFPSVLIRCRDCRKGDLPIGELVLDMQRYGHELQIRNFRFNNDAMSLSSGAGRWYVDIDGRPHTTLSLQARVPLPGRLMATPGKGSMLTGGALQANGWVSWSGAPFEFSLPALSGNVNVKMGQGSLTDVDPGIGRLLGLLNVQRLPDRLAMDFHDMTTPGVAFDEISGNLKLEQGVLSTEDTIIKAAAMVAGISGETDLLQKTHRQELTVKPNFGSALPVVGTVMAGPGAGAALLLFNSLAEGEAEDRVKSPGGMRYRISGSWDNPQINQIKTPVVSTDVDVFPH